jgi:hypothetical protein
VLSAASPRAQVDPRGRGQAGITLLEVMIGMIVMVVLIVPLSMVFIASIRGSASADDQYTRSGDAQRIGAAWTNDVQNVDVGGVNSGESCPAPSGFNGEETHLVSFSWNLSSSAQGAPRTATWVAVGAGEDLELMRRECESGSLIDERMLAMRVGEEGQGVLDVVHGPGSPAGDFCPPVNKQTNASLPAVWVSEACTIKVTGSFDYDLTVTRRVPDRVSGPTTARAPDAPAINDAIGRNQYLTVSWTKLTPPSDQPAIEQYRVFIYTNPSGAPTSNVLVDSQSNFATFTGLTNDTNYWLRVQARNRVGWGELSDVHGPVTPHSTEPDAPTVPSVTPGDTSVTVNWTANPNDGGSPVTAWHVWAIDLNGVETGPVVITPGTQLNGQVTGLINGTSYRVVVAGVNANGVGLRSDYSEVVKPYGAPPPAGSVVAQANDAKVKLRWVPPANDNGRPIVGYVIRVYSGLNATTPVSSTGDYLTNAQANCTVSVCEVDRTVANGEYYRFTVASRSDVGNGTTIDGSPSEKSTPFATPAVQPKQPPHVRPSGAPATPSTPSISRPSGSTVRVAFTLPANGGEPIERVFIEYQTRSTASGSQWSSGWTQADTAGYAVSGNAGDAKTQDFSGSSGTVYRVRISVANKGEWFSGAASWRTSAVSGNSNELTLASAPSTPGTPTVVKTPNTSYPFSATASWSRPANDGGACIDQYEVRFSNDGTNVVSTQTHTSTPGSGCSNEPALSKVWGNITAGSPTRYFSVRARNTTGEWSSWSAYGSTSALRETCSLAASEDAWVNEDRGTWWFGYPDDRRNNNYGTATRLRNDSSGDQIYLKFNPRSDGTNCQFGVPLPSAAVVVSGDIQAYNESSTTFNRDLDMFLVTGSWAEGSITYNNKPGWAGSYSDRESAADGGLRTWAVNNADINQQRTGNRYGWTIRNTGGNILSDWSEFRSREWGGGPAPTLRITFY